MKNYVVIDGNNHLLIGMSVALKNAKTEEEFGDYSYNVISSMLRNLKKKFDGKFYVCWDTYGGTASRKNIDSNYKANRDHTKINFEIMESCKTIYEEWGIESISIPHCEADDAIFVLCKLLRENSPQSKITIVSRDHDLIQVVQAGYASEIYDVSKKKNMDIPWYSIVQYKALVGDKSDCISGVAGIGEKTAIKIIAGNMKLTESQQEEYEKSLNLVDATRNPQYMENYNLLKDKLIFD